MYKGGGGELFLLIDFQQRHFFFEKKIADIQTSSKSFQNVSAKIRIFFLENLD